MNELHISLHVEPDSDAALAVDEGADLALNLGEKFEGGGTPYSGRYEVTPGESTQVLETAYHKMTANVVVNPIPSNYGLITWNGATLTVS